METRVKFANNKGLWLGLVSKISIPHRATYNIGPHDRDDMEDGKCLQPGLEKLALFVVTMALILPSIILFVRADSINPGVFSVDSKPYNMTYEEWTIKYWQWILSIPKNNNPANDNTGKNCALGQSGPVWFLAGTFGGSNSRTCTIPSGKAILFTILNGECTYADTPSAKTDSDLRACALATDAGINTLAATIDGKNLQQLDKYRITSSPFNVTLVDNNILGAKAGPTRGVSDGWWFLVQPLSLGMHEIHFIGSLLNPTVTSTNPRFVTEVTYHLTVK
jgi:hypothetical protein